MKYTTKNWPLDAFEYDPHGFKPQWWLDMVANGHGFEFSVSLTVKRAYASFGDKRSQHKAFIGDYIVRDVFGRIDVYSARNWAQRVKLMEVEHGTI